MGEKSKGFIGEFKEFIARGNVMDIAVGVIIGGAFQAIVNSLIEDIFNPFLGLLLGGLDFSKYVATIGGVDVKYGSFISAIINFLIMAFVIFCIVKAMNKAASINAKPVEEAAPTTKVCPYCKSEIPIDATKCAHCTSDVE